MGFMLNKYSCATGDEFVTVLLGCYRLTNNILSSAQQIWLQKMGGASNPVKKMNFEALKEERTKVQEPVFQNMLVKEPPKIEKPDAQGYRPGDRFKQLKEEEARRKQQKEAEKSKEILLKSETERGDMKVDHQLDTNTIKSPNGDPSSSDSNQGDQTLISRMEDIEDSVRFSTTRDQQNLDDNLEKEKTASRTTENKSSTEDKHQEERA